MEKPTALRGWELQSAGVRGKDTPTLNMGEMHRPDPCVTGSVRVVYGAIPWPRIQEGRRRVRMLDGLGLLCGGGSASRAEDDLAKQAL